jgi:hypothetical protein
MNHKRVDGITVKQEFDRAIQQTGGSRDAHRKAVQAETRELFDCDLDQLYSGTGGKKGDRTTLPTPAQEAYIINETISKHRLNHDVVENNKQAGSQQQKDDRIVESVRDTAENVRKWLPW